jgi:4a-hydroxytetrahydrobiopterin dehydratase
VINYGNARAERIAADPDALAAKIKALRPEQAAIGNWHDGRVPSRSFEVAIDANDPQRLRRFWKAALGYVEQTTPEGAVDLVDPAGRRPTIWFQQVPEPKTVKNRLHLDLHITAAERAALTQQLTALGGAVIQEHPRFTVMADPEGNELCLAEG